MMTPEQIHDWRKLWLTNGGYRNYIVDTANESGCKVQTIAILEIALNLHEIAQQLAEMNNYAPQSFESIEVEDE